MIVGGLTDALSSIIAGQKSAEEAFLSLLASFLQFISEQAAIKAAFANLTDETFAAALAACFGPDASKSPDTHYVPKWLVDYIRFPKSGG